MGIRFYYGDLTLMLVQLMDYRVRVRGTLNPVVQSGSSLKSVILFSWTNYSLLVISVSPPAWCERPSVPT